MTKILNSRHTFWEFENLDLGFVSDWSETDASPDIRISDFSLGAYVALAV